MEVVERAVGGICRAVLWISTSVIFVILVANTVLRYATGSSLQWANEVPELLFPWLVMAGVVLAALHGAHITTTFLVEKVPFAIRRPLLLCSQATTSRPRRWASAANPPLPAPTSRYRCAFGKTSPKVRITPGAQFRRLGPANLVVRQSNPAVVEIILHGAPLVGGPSAPRIEGLLLTSPHATVKWHRGRARVRWRGGRPRRTAPHRA